MGDAVIVIVVDRHVERRLRDTAQVFGLGVDSLVSSIIDNVMNDAALFRRIFGRDFE